MGYGSRFLSPRFCGRVHQTIEAGSPTYFARRPLPKTPQDLTAHDCINLRLLTYGGLYAWEFEKDGQAMQVQEQGQFVFNTTPQMLRAALAGFGLAYVPEDVVREHVVEGTSSRSLQTGVPPFQATTSTIQATASLHRPLLWW